MGLKPITAYGVLRVVYNEAWFKKTERKKKDGVIHKKDLTTYALVCPGDGGGGGEGSGPRSTHYTGTIEGAASDMQGKHKKRLLLDARSSS